MEQREPSEGWVFVFNGADPTGRGNIAFASGVFSSRERAEEWIARRRLAGVLTAYPLNEGAYDWAVANGHFKPKRDDQRTPEFIGRFASGHLHWHYDNGSEDGDEPSPPAESAENPI